MSRSRASRSPSPQGITKTIIWRSAVYDEHQFTQPMGYKIEIEDSVLYNLGFGYNLQPNDPRIVTEWVPYLKHLLNYTSIFFQQHSTAFIDFMIYCSLPFELFENIQSIVFKHKQHNSHWLPLVPNIKRCVLEFKNSEDFVEYNTNALKAEQQMLMDLDANFADNESEFGNVNLSDIFVDEGGGYDNAQQYYQDAADFGNAVEGVYGNPGPGEKGYRRLHRSDAEYDFGLQDIFANRGNIPEAQAADSYDYTTDPVPTMAAYSTDLATVLPSRPPPMTTRKRKRNGDGLPVAEILNASGGGKKRKYKKHNTLRRRRKEIRCRKRQPR